MRLRLARKHHFENRRIKGGSNQVAVEFEKLTHAAQRKALGAAVDAALKQRDQDREKTYLQIVNLAKTFYGKNIKPESIERVQKAIQDPDNKWMRFINRILDETDPYVARTTLLNLGYEAFFRGTKMIRENREKYDCNIPWLILFDPTSACNMHCTGCWAGTYGNRHNLSFEDMDRIVSEGKELGTYLYMLTGGEPLVRKKDILRLAEKHSDVEFAIYTNSTLVDEAFCKEVVRLGNIMFQLSIEGTPQTNDGRRGEGHYDAVMNAMDLFKKYGILFGTSVCYTRDNIEAVTSDDFFRLITQKGARYGFYFHYMPTGNAAVPELMPTKEQRKYMIDRIRYIRTQECPIEFFPMDFQNDGEYVGGCIAGGRNYFHINSEGDMEPCVFVHFSDSNIRSKTILEGLQSPLFMAYYHNQPFNDNHLRPCPMLENPQYLRMMVNQTGAKSTELIEKEDVETLCAKCDKFASEWQPIADKFWSETVHKPTRTTYYRDSLEANLKKD